ncbi:MAG: hypothetical protein ACFE8E_11585 [Candidatus Hodarchaeota archaeon]
MIKCNSDGIIQWNSTFFNYAVFFSQAPMKILLGTDGIMYRSETNLIKFEWNYEWI